MVRPAPATAGARLSVVVENDSPAPRVKPMAAADNVSDRVLDGGMAVLVKTATDTWALAGDIANS